MCCQGDGIGEVVELQELRTGVILTQTLTHTCSKSASQAAGAVGRHRYHWAQDCCSATRRTSTPVVDHLLDGRELTSEHEIEIGSKRRIFSERDGIVGPCSVHHCRGHKNEMAYPRLLGHLEQRRCTSRHALATARPRVVIARREVYRNVHRLSRFGGGCCLECNALSCRRHHVKTTFIGKALHNSGAKTALGPRHQYRRHGCDDNRWNGRSILDMTAGDPADNPFGGLPMFGDLARALSGQGPLNWDAAKQFAHLAATNGEPEANVDPNVRFALTALAGIAEPHVVDVTGHGLGTYEITTVTPGVWAQQTLEAYRPLFTELAVSLGKRPAVADDQDAGTPDPMTAMMLGLSQMMAPAMLGMAIGSMVGHLATRAFGQYDLPIPRSASAQVTISPATVDTFADDWSLPRDSMRLWVLVQELVSHVVFSVEHIREGLSELVRAHVGAFQADPSAVAEKLGTIEMDSDDPMQAIQRSLGDPEILLGAVRSAAQEALQPQLDAALAAVVGYVDHAVDLIASRLIGGDATRISEAVRRRRIETSPDDIFVERLLGLRLNRQQVDKGREFTAGAFERGGNDAVNLLLSRPRALPTPAELLAPGLWLARLELPTDEPPAPSTA